MKAAAVTHPAKVVNPSVAPRIAYIIQAATTTSALVSGRKKTHLWRVRIGTGDASEDSGYLLRENQLNYPDQSSKTSPRKKAGTGARDSRSRIERKVVASGKEVGTDRSSAAKSDRTVERRRSVSF